MPTPPVIDVESLLEPISPEQPAGKSFTYEPEYDALREARRSEDASLQGDWERDTKTADWDLVSELGQKLIRRHTKDLQVAAWLTEALGKKHGFAGLRDGLRLLHGIQENFWDSYYPEVEEGDLDSRVGPFLFLNNPRYLPLLTRSIPLTQGIDAQNYSYLKYQEAEKTDNEIRKNPDKESELLGEGKITLEMFKTATIQTPKAFYVLLVEDIKGCIEAFKAFEKSTDDRFQKDAPSLLNLSKALDECRLLLESLLAQKRKLEPDPVATAPPAASPSQAADAVPSQVRETNPGATSALASMLPARGGSDPGQVLISFLEGAQELSEVGNRLKENRQRHAQLMDQLRELDAEYDELSQTVSRNQEFFDLLTRMNQLRGGVDRVPLPERVPEPEEETAEDEPDAETTEEE